MRLFVQISYNGTHYRGWQRQAVTNNTVQEVIESTLIKVLKYDLYVSACGRTDAGVHASSFFFHFDIKAPLTFDLCERMNRVLPSDIVFIKAFEVDTTINARFNATQRIYNYYFHLHRNPFDNEISTYIDFSIDVSLILEAIELLKPIKDFRFLCKQPDKHRTTLCDLFSLKLYRDDDSTRFRIEISADRFLRGMVRVIVARLLEVGKGKMSLQQFQESLYSELLFTIKPAYPQGLFLTHVNYSFLDGDPTNLSLMPHQRKWNLCSL